MALCCGDAFRVELNRMDRQVAMPETHDGAVLAGGVDDQRFGNLLHDQRMIAGGGEGRRQPLEQAAAVTGDRKSVVSGKSVSIRVDLGGRRLIKKKTQEVTTRYRINTNHKQIPQQHDTHTK